MTQRTRYTASRPSAAQALLLLVVLAAPVSAGSETLGRLFFTADERAALERERRLDVQESPAAKTFGLNGIVRPANGKPTVWINGVARRDGSDPHVELAPKDPSRATLRAGDGPPLSLRVGESADQATREIKDGLDGGSIRGARKALRR